MRLTEVEVAADLTERILTRYFITTESVVVIASGLVQLDQLSHLWFLFEESSNTQHQVWLLETNVELLQSTDVTRDVALVPDVLLQVESCSVHRIHLIINIG